MGRSSAAKDLRRLQREGQVLAMQKSQAVLLKQMADQLLSPAPGLQALGEAMAEDTGLHERIAADLPAQQMRLRSAGWRRAWEHLTGAGGWVHAEQRLKMIHGVLRWTDGHMWSHISLSRDDGRLPDWYQLSAAHRAMYPDRRGVQVATPLSSHVNIAEVAHVWTCLTADSCPDFGQFGTI